MAEQWPIAPVFGVHVEYTEVEKALQATYGASRRKKSLHLDLSNVGRISPLAFCSLYCWAFDVASKKGKVKLSSPKGGNHATSLFASAGILSAIAADDRVSEAVQTGELGVTDRYLSAFEVFSAERDLESYSESLATSSGRKTILRAQDDYPLLSSGDFCNVIVRELVGNTFVHACGSGSHYCAYGYETSGKKSDPILAEFTRPAPLVNSELRLFSTKGPRASQTSRHPGYVEICIADSGTENLYESLSSAYDDPKPKLKYWCDRTQRLTPHDLMLLFAFNYESTRDANKRAERVAEYISDWNPGTAGASAIATGLYRIRRLAELYGGQIVIRTDKRIGTIDYSSKSLVNGKPRVAFLHRIEGKELAPLRGTIVCVRAPVTRSPLGKPVMVSQFVERDEQVHPRGRIHAVGPSLQRPGAARPSVLSASRAIAECVDSGISHAENHDVVVAVLDGVQNLLGVTRNVIIALVDVLAQTQRDCALAILFDNEDLVDEAARAYETLKEKLGTAPIDARACTVLLGPQVGDEEYGERSQPGSAYVEDRHICGPGGVRLPVQTLGHQARRKRLHSLITSSVVRDSRDNHLYLNPAESGYYRKYFRISRLVNSHLARETLHRWLAKEIRAIGPAAIIAYTPLIVAAVQAATEGQLSAPPCYALVAGRSLSLAAKCEKHCAGEKRLLLITDVLADDDTHILRFLEALHRPSKCDLLVLVDGRETPAIPLQVREESYYAQVPIDSVVCESLETVQIRGATPAKNVLQVDPETHELLEYVFAPSYKGSDTADEQIASIRRGLSLLDRADEASSLIVGHFNLGGRHYDRFFELEKLFGQLGEQIQDWLKGKEIGEIAASRIAPKAVQVCCLDEGTGLSKIVDRSLAKSGFRPIWHLKKLQDLAKVSNYGEAEAMWFILPVHDKGRGLEFCMTIAARLKAKYARISVIVDRSHPRRQTFVDGLDRFRGMEVRFSRMYTLPLGHAEGVCWLCTIESALRVASRATRDTYPHLHSIVESAGYSLRPVTIESAGNSGILMLVNKPPALAGEFRVRSLYERAAVGDLDAQQLLCEELLNVSNYDALARAASTGPASLFDYSLDP